MHTSSNPRYWPRRYTVLGLIFCSSFICYIDRVNISVAIVPMAKQYGWGDATKGLILSSFFAGYLVTQIAGGWLANRFGGKAVLACGVLWWSVFTLLTPPAAALSLTVLVMARIAMGMGEGIAFPAIYNLFGRWIPAPEKARAVAFNLSGISLGTLFAISVTPWVITSFGWEAVFYLFGAAGFVWFAVWQVKVTNSPADDPSISASERDYIMQTSVVDTEPEAIPWRKLLSQAPVWAIIINHFCSNWGFYVLLSWLPSYFADALDIRIGAVWLYAAPPWITMFIMSNVAGAIADNLIKRGLSTTFVRKLMECIGMLGPALFLILISKTTEPVTAVVLLCFALGLASFVFSGFPANHLDISPRYADILFGISNTAGTLPGIVGVALTGWLIETSGAYSSAFLLAAAIYVFGTIVWLLFATGERIPELN